MDTGFNSDIQHRQHALSMLSGWNKKPCLRTPARQKKIVRRIRLQRAAYERYYDNIHKRFVGLDEVVSHLTADQAASGEAVESGTLLDAFLSYQHWAQADMKSGPENIDDWIE